MYRVPGWAQEFEASTPRLAVFREIAYVDETGLIEGIGRSWIPVSRRGIAVLAQCFTPFNPKPLGVVLERRYNDQQEVIVHGIEANSDENRSPYLANTEFLWIARRSIRVMGSLLAYVEEEFSDSSD